MKRLILAFVSATAISAIAASGVAEGTRANEASGVSRESGPAVAAAAIDRQTLLQKVQAWSLINKRVDRIDAKLVLWSEYLAGANQAVDVGTDPNQLVWIVAVSGLVQPDTAHGQQFTWAVYAFDAATGRTRSTNAGRDATRWPPYFDGLRDRSAR